MPYYSVKWAILVPILTTVGVVVAVALSAKFKRDMATSTKNVLLVDRTTKHSVPLIEKRVLNHDTRIFRFSLPNPDIALGVPVGQHVHVQAPNINGERVTHSYTPISSDDDRGFFDLLVKVYFKNTHPKYPNGGRLTQFMDNLKIGETIDIFKPSGRLIYNGRGSFSIKPTKTDPFDEYHYNKVVMIAGGSGIAPMLQIIRAVVKDPEDKTQLVLLFANRAEEDIVPRDELEETAKKHPDRLKIWYTIDKATEGWEYSSGYINSEMIKEHTFPPASDTLVVMCGPDPMIEFACTPSLDKLDYDPKNRFIY